MNIISPQYPNDADAVSVIDKLKLKDPGFRTGWVSALSDPFKLSEFINAYESLALEPLEKFTLMDLIINSFNDALENGWNDRYYSDKILELIKKDLPLYKNLIVYWSCIDDGDNTEDCFGITPHVRTLLPLL